MSFHFSILKILFCLWDSVISCKKSAIISIAGPFLYNRSFFSGYFQDFFLYNWLIVSHFPINCIGVVSFVFILLEVS